MPLLAGRKNRRFHSGLQSAEQSEGDRVLRDIRDLTSDPEAYAAELQQRWGGLLSYRYIGRPTPR